MEVQNTTSSSPSSSPSAENKALNTSSLPSADNTNKGVAVRSFDCAICYDSLMKPGPALECFTFGKLLINVSQLPYLEREHIYREFSLVDQCFSDGKFDCDKIVVTICGHIFHSGCIREWFFMKRLDRTPKCPFCNRRTCYEECRIIHPLTCLPFDDDDEPFEQEEAQVSLHETEYSDISCTSSSWPSDDESDDSDGEEEGRISQPEVSANVESHELPEVTFYTDDSEEDDHDFENFDRIPMTCDDTLYYPVFTHLTNSRDRSDIRMRKPGKITRMLEFIGKFDLLHVVTLINLCKGACKLYCAKKEDFLAHVETIMDNEEDENLAAIDHESLVPLGYDFVCLSFIIWLFIWIAEKYADIFTKNNKNGRAISSPMMMMHFLTFNVFATFCLLITHEMFC